MFDTIFDFDFIQCLNFFVQLKSFPVVEPGYFLTADDLFSLFVLRASFFDFVTIRLNMLKQEDNCFISARFGDLLENPVF